MTIRSTQVTLVAVLATVSMLAGCATKPTSYSTSRGSASTSLDEEPAVPAPAEVATSEPSVPGPADPGPPTTSGSPFPGSPPASGSPPVGPPAEFVEHPDVKDAYFNPGSSAVGPGAARTLNGNAEWLKTNAGYLVLIEGHSDPQGTRAANLVLGERRAKAAMSYLLKQGVVQSRMLVVSYGADRLVCTEQTDACLAKNRRVHFLVKAQ